jgi:hypothetical protein
MMEKGENRDRRLEEGFKEFCETSEGWLREFFQVKFENKKQIVQEYEKTNERYEIALKSLDENFGVLARLRARKGRLLKQIEISRSEIEEFKQFPYNGLDWKIENSEFDKLMNYQKECKNKTVELFSMYEKILGVTIKAVENNVIVKFQNFSMPDGKGTISMRYSDGIWSMNNCSPFIENIDEIIAKYNISASFGEFLKEVRIEFSKFCKN